jgi:hypothetical protein
MVIDVHSVRHAGQPARIAASAACDSEEVDGFPLGDTSPTGVTSKSRPLANRSSPRKLEIPMRSLVALLCLFVFCTGAASAAAYVFPRNGLSAQDEAYALFTETCSEEPADLVREPDVQRTDTGFVVNFYRMRPAQEHFCFTPAPPPSLYPVLLGRLPKGEVVVEMRDHVRNHNSDVYTLIATHREKLKVGNTPNPAVSGSWYDPASSGTGLFISLMPTRRQPDPRAMMVLNTVDQDGNAVWYSGVGTFADGTLTVSMTRGGQTTPSATGVFQYDGCGRGAFELLGQFPRFPVGKTPVLQIARTLDAGGCEPTQYSLRGEDL